MASRLEDFMEVRRKLDATHFFDLRFEEITEDPLGAIERLYKHFDIAMTDDARSALRGHVRNNPRGKHGEHRYTAADFGLTDTTIRDRFAAYIDAFDVTPEAST